MLSVPALAAGPDADLQILTRSVSGVTLTDGRVNPLTPAMGPNVAGVPGTAVAAGAFLALLG